MLFIIDLVRLSLTLIIVVSLLIAKVNLIPNNLLLDNSTSKRKAEM
jgi:hypothetical protein